MDVPADVDKATFLKWRDARRGTAEPEVMNNPLWHWLVATGNTSAYSVNKHFNGPCSYDTQAIWESQRYGQSKTLLPDGREILIAGEHEDSYDPDFFIYNDIIIRYPEGKIDFLGYPKNIFQPTDFHTATLVGERIILIGNLGYPDGRKHGTTQILIVDTHTWKITIQSSVGGSPGWIHDHKAVLADDQKSISIQGGVVELEDADKPHLENIDTWVLHLEGWRWERITQLDWPLFEIKRLDNEMNKIWEMRQWVWSSKNNMPSSVEYPEPNDPELIETLYSPASIVHQVLPEIEDEYSVYRIEIEGICVRYIESHYNIMMTVEGDLKAGIVTYLLEDIVVKLSKLESTEYGYVQCR